MFYEDIVTIFNRYVDSAGNTVWHPHVISEANLQMDKATIVSKYGADSKDNAVLNVRYHFLENAKVIGNKTYLPPKEWRKQEEVSSECITFASGSDFDFFILGDYGSEEPILDEAGNIYSNMKKEYDFVFAVTSVSCLKAIPHFEITGK